MEIGSIAKPAAVSTPPAPQRVESLATAGAVKTELAPEASVQQAGKAEAVRFEPTQGVQARAALEAAIRDVIEHNITIDPKSREVVFQSIDKRTGEVVRQVPDETLLKLRAYAREMREAESSDGEVRRVEKIA